MDSALKDLVLCLRNSRVFGGKHTPEHKLLRSISKYLTKTERKEFQKGYKILVNKNIILRTKKMTGEESDWHISLNPRKTKEIGEIIEGKPIL
jgi:hypothetical protein